MLGLFLSLGRVLPDRYPASGDVAMYLAEEHRLGRMLDDGVIQPIQFRFPQHMSLHSSSPHSPGADRSGSSPSSPILGGIHTRSSMAALADRGKVSEVDAGVAAEQRGIAFEVVSPRTVRVLR